MRLRSSTVVVAPNPPDPIASRPLFFPNEILAEILNFLVESPLHTDLTLTSRNNDLFLASLVSKQFKAACYDLLYGHIFINWSVLSGLPLLRSFEENPALFSRVRRLSAFALTPRTFNLTWLRTEEGLRALAEAEPLRLQEDEAWEEFMGDRAMDALEGSGNEDWLQDEEGSILGERAFWDWVGKLRALQVLVLANFEHPLPPSEDLNSVLSNIERATAVNSSPDGLIPSLTSAVSISLANVATSDSASTVSSPPLPKLEFLHAINSSSTVMALLQRRPSALVSLTLDGVEPDALSDIGAALTHLPSLILLDLTLEVPLDLPLDFLIALQNSPIKNFACNILPHAILLPYLPKTLRCLILLAFIEHYNPDVPPGASSVGAGEGRSSFDFALIESVTDWKTKYAPNLELVNITMEHLKDLKYPDEAGIRARITEIVKGTTDFAIELRELSSDPRNEGEN
ncbi:hypothetical protein P7C70_g3245, partial [Phenoliferia sp. Uapishka_3]